MSEIGSNFNRVVDNNLTLTSETNIQGNTQIDPALQIAGTDIIQQNQDEQEKKINTQAQSNVSLKSLVSDKETNQSNFENIAHQALSATTVSQPADGVKQILSMERSMLATHATTASNQQTEAGAYLEKMPPEKCFDPKAASTKYNSPLANELNQHLQAYATVAKNDPSSDSASLAAYKSSAFISDCATYFPSFFKSEQNPFIALGTELFDLVSANDKESLSEAKSKIQQQLDKIEQGCTSPEQKEVHQVLSQYFDQLIQDKQSVIDAIDGSTPQFSIDNEDPQQAKISNVFSKHSGLALIGVSDTDVEANRQDEAKLNGLLHKIQNSDQKLGVEELAGIYDPSAQKIASSLLEKYSTQYLLNSAQQIVSDISYQAQSISSGSTASNKTEPTTPVDPQKLYELHRITNLFQQHLEQGLATPEDALAMIETLKSMPWTSSANEKEYIQDQITEFTDQTNQLLQKQEQASSQTPAKDPATASEPKSQTPNIDPQTKSQATLQCQQALNLLKSNISNTLGVKESEILRNKYALDDAMHPQNFLANVHEMLSNTLADTLPSQEAAKLFGFIADKYKDQQPELYQQLQNKLEILNDPTASQEASRTAFNDVRRALLVFSSIPENMFADVAKQVCPNPTNAANGAAQGNDSNLTATQSPNLDKSCQEFVSLLLNSDGNALAQRLNTLAHENTQNNDTVNMLTSELSKPHSYSATTNNITAYNVLRNLSAASNTLSALQNNSFFKEALTDPEKLFNTEALDQQIASLQKNSSKEATKQLEKLTNAKKHIDDLASSWKAYTQSGKSTDFLKFMNALHNLDSSELALSLKAQDSSSAPEASNTEANKNASGTTPENSSKPNNPNEALLKDFNKLKSKDYLLLNYAYHSYCAETGKTESFSKENQETHNGFLQQIASVDPQAATKKNSYVNQLQEMFNSRDLNAKGFSKLAHLASLKAASPDLDKDPRVQHSMRAFKYLCKVLGFPEEKFDNQLGYDALKKKVIDALKNNPQLGALLDELQLQFDAKTTSPKLAKQILDLLGLTEEDAKSIIKDYYSPTLPSERGITLNSQFQDRSAQKGETAAFALLGLTSVLVQDPNQLPDSFLQNVAKIPVPQTDKSQEVSGSSSVSGSSAVTSGSASDESNHISLIKDEEVYKRPLSLDQLRTGFLNLANRPASWFEARTFLQAAYPMWQATHPDFPEKMSQLEPQQASAFISDFTQDPNGDPVSNALAATIKHDDFINAQANTNSYRYTSFSHSEQLELVGSLEKHLTANTLALDKNTDVKEVSNQIGQLKQKLTDITSLENQVKEQALTRLKKENPQAAVNLTIDSPEVLQSPEYQDLQKSPGYQAFVKGKDSMLRNVLGTLYGEGCKRLESARYALATKPVSTIFKTEHMVHVSNKLFGSSIKSQLKDGVYQTPATPKEKFMGVMRDTFMEQSIFNSTTVLIEKNQEKQVKQLLNGNNDAVQNFGYVLFAAIEDTMSQLNIANTDELAKRYQDPAQAETLHKSLVKNLASFFDESVAKATDEQLQNNQAYKCADLLIQTLDLKNHPKTMQLSSDLKNLQTTLSIEAKNLCETIANLSNKQNRQAVSDKHDLQKQQMLFTGMERLLQQVPVKGTLTNSKEYGLSVQVAGIQEEENIGCLKAGINAGVNVGAAFGQEFSLTKNEDGSFDVFLASDVSLHASAQVNAKLEVSAPVADKPTTVASVEAGVGASIKGGAGLTEKFHCNSQAEAAILLAKLQSGTISKEDLANLKSGKKLFFEGSFDLALICMASAQQAARNVVGAAIKEEQIQETLSDLDSEATKSIESTNTKLKENVSNLHTLVQSGTNSTLDFVADQANVLKEQVTDTAKQTITNTANNLTDSVVSETIATVQFFTESTPQNAGVPTNQESSSDTDNNVDEQTDANSQPEQSAEHRSFGEKAKTKGSEFVAEQVITKAQGLPQELAQQLVNKAVDTAKKLFDPTKNEEADKQSQDPDTQSETNKPDSTYGTPDESAANDKRQYNLKVNADFKANGNFKFVYASSVDQNTKYETMEVSGSVYVEVNGRNMFANTPLPDKSKELPESGKSSSFEQTNPDANPQSYLHTVTKNTQEHQMQHTGLLQMHHTFTIERNRLASKNTDQSITNLGLELGYTAHDANTLLHGLVKNGVPLSTAKYICKSVPDYPINFTFDAEWNAQDPQLPCSDKELTSEQRKNLCNYKITNLTLTKENSSSSSRSLFNGMVQYSSTSANSKSVSLPQSAWQNSSLVISRFDQFKQDNVANTPSSQTKDEEMVASANLLFQQNAVNHLTQLDQANSNHGAGQSPV